VCVPKSTSIVCQSRYLHILRAVNWFMMSPSTCVVFHYALCATLAHANDFLKSAPKVLNEHVSEDDIKTSLLEEVESSIGSGPTSRLAQMEEILKPIYTSLPKNEHGKLGHMTVHYALHRMFVARHGWNIRGLAPIAGGLDSSSPAGILKDQVPEYIQDLFERRLAGKGFGLRDLAVLAATVEHLIHEEAVVNLGSAFSVHEFLPTTVLDEAQASEVLNTYMMSYILGEDLNNMTLADAQGLNSEMPDMFLAWNHTQGFVHSIRLNVTEASTKAGDAAPPLDFSLLSRVVESVAENYGTFQDSECQHIKSSLHMMEYRGTGRVKLSDFYKPALDGSWQFQESVAYLRQAGALDETDPNDASVIIPNYLHSQTNCIASSGFYSVCCKNECESLMGRFEREIAAPEATPDAIAKIAGELSSPSVTAPREISETLMNRLDDIAAQHDRLVPIHGRLFAQWMHHAYPRECPYPHVASNLSPEEWLDETTEEAIASEEEMQSFTNVTDSAATEVLARGEDLMPWSQEEELLVVQTSSGFAPDFTLQYEAGWSPFMRSILLLAVAGSMALTLIQFVNPSTPEKGAQGTKHL